MKQEVRLSSWDVEERVTAALARLGGVPESYIKPELRLEDLGCDAWAVLDLIEVLEHELGVASGIDLRAKGRSDLSNFGGHPTLPESVWDIVKLFDRARHTQEAFVLATRMKRPRRQSESEI